MGTPSSWNSNPTFRSRENELPKTRSIKRKARSSPRKSSSNPIFPGGLSARGEDLGHVLALRSVAEAVEAAFLGNELRRPHEATPRGPRERSTDADPAHAERRNIAQRHVAGPSKQQIHRFGRDSGDDRGDILGRANARRVQAIGARVRIRLQSRNRLREIGTADEKALGASYQQRVAASLVDGPARRADPFDRHADVVERIAGNTGRILDRHPGHTR